MIRDEMNNIKKNGKLLAFNSRRESGWQYWEHNGIVYSINSDGDPDRASIWCSIKNLNCHLYYLYKVGGRKFFTEDEDIVIVDKNRMSEFEWA